MLRYSLTFFVLLIAFAKLSAVILFAQPSGNNAVTTPQRNDRYLANMQYPSGLLAAVARSYNNALDKGLMGSVMIFEGSRKEELRKSMGITDTQFQEIATFRKAIQIKVVTKIPEMIKHYSDTNENNQKIIQTDLEADIQKFIDKINTITTPEQQAKAKELAFQATGGLNSPFIGKDTLDIFDLTKEQREKAELIIEQTKAERNAKIDELIKLFEENNARFNRKKLTQEELNELRKKREALLAEFLAIGKKTGDRLKGFLNDQQRKKAEYLIANTPEFLPKLPMKIADVSPYIPNPDSWKPGQGVPDSEKNSKNSKKNFPRKNLNNSTQKLPKD
jgi:hypothetical protein